MLKLADCLDKTGRMEDDVEAQEIREEVQTMCKDDPVKRNIPLDDERAWNQLVSVDYRCL